jgi:thiamine biosynthesis lipoprotein
MSIHHVEHVMGMAVSIDVHDLPAGSKALDDVVAWLHRVDATFSTYREDSEVTKLGRGEIGIEDLSPDVEEVLLRCIDLSERTNGAFDAFAVPAPNGTTLDPSGYVKGWSIEHAAGMLTASGATNFCINAGGDIAIRGVPSPGTAWRIGVRHPDLADKVALTLELEGPMAIATSATYERGAHIVDPSSGEAVTDIASATVVGPDLGIADAFATAVFVMGEDGLEWIESHDGYSAYIITHDGVTRWSSRFPHRAAIDGASQRITTTGARA